MRNYYQPTKQFYCGVDLHSRSIYVCVIDKDQKKLEHMNLKNKETHKLLKLLEPYKHSLVVGCESSYAWYWLADLCADNDVDFILGHALYMKAIHGAKVKNDRVDSHKIALLMQSGMFPVGYVYPAYKRSIRDLLRRRLYFVCQRADLFSHIQLLNNQVNNTPLGQLSKTNYKKKCSNTVFKDKHLIRSIDCDLRLLEDYDYVIRDIEKYIMEHTRKDYRQELNIIQSIHGIGEVIALTILYEIDSIDRFDKVGEFISYCRLIRCTHESGGKRLAGSNSKIGNPHLKRAFSAAATYTIKFNPQIEKRFNRLCNKKSRKLAYGIIARELANSIYHMLKNKTVFNMDRFLNG